MLTKAEGIREELQGLIHEAQGLTSLKAAADDPASNTYNTTLTWNGQTGAFGHGSDHVHLELAYVQHLVDRLRESLHKVPESDRQREKNITQAGSGTGDGFL